MIRVVRVKVSGGKKIKKKSIFALVRTRPYSEARKFRAHKLRLCPRERERESESVYRSIKSRRGGKKEGYPRKSFPATPANLPFRVRQLVSKVNELSRPRCHSRFNSSINASRVLRRLLIESLRRNEQPRNARSISRSS